MRRIVSAVIMCTPGGRPIVAQPMPRLPVWIGSRINRLYPLQGLHLHRRQHYLEFSMAESCVAPRSDRCDNVAGRLLRAIMPPAVKRPRAGPPVSGAPPPEDPEPCRSSTGALPPA